MKLKSKLFIGGLTASLLLVAPAAVAQLGSALDKGERAIQTSARAQAQINQANTEANELVREYRDLLVRRDSARVFASQQRSRVEGQREELESIEGQLLRVDEIVEQAAPMMIQMIDDLDLFIESDLPFKLDVRRDAISELRELMISANVSDAERYRKIIEAYQNELEYGRTVQTWSADVDVNGETVSYEFFLYGRAALVRMNQLAGDASRWSRSQGAWVDMPSSSIDDIKQAIRIADKKSPPAVMMTVVEKFSVKR